MKKLIIGASLLFLSCFARSQGLDSVFVETYYVSDASDSVGSAANFGGVLPAGSVTYRIYVDMAPGYKFQALYGINTPLHNLLISTTTSFFNNEDRGSTAPTFTKAQAAGNSIMLDSWFSAGAASSGQIGVPKSADDGVSNVVNSDAMLQNNNAVAGIPLTVQDGMIAGSPEDVSFIGLPTELDVFDATSQAGNSFSTANGSIASLNGSVGPDALNRVLVGQFTTDGQFCYELNIQIAHDSVPGYQVTESYVAQNPSGREISVPSLMGCSSYIFTNVSDINASRSLTVFPDPATDFVSFEVDPSKQNTGYTVYGVEGKIVLHKDLGAVSQKHMEKVDVSLFPAGVYIIELSTDGHTSFQKIIKN